MHFNLNPIGMFIIASLTLFLSLTNAYMEIPRLETHERRHGNITIDCTSKYYILFPPFSFKTPQLILHSHILRPSQQRVHHLQFNLPPLHQHANLLPRRAILNRLQKRRLPLVLQHLRQQLFLLHIPAAQLQRYRVSPPDNDSPLGIRD